jgi:hypothetical protein
LIDYPEVIREKRKDTAHWITWLIAADFGEKLPSIAVLTGEQEAVKPARKMTPERKAKLQEAERRHEKVLQQKAEKENQKKTKKRG